MAIKTSLIMAVSMTMFGSAIGQTVTGSAYNSPSAGPPASFFAAATTMPVAALQSAAAKASKVPKSASYLVNFDDNSPTATIHNDWAALSTGAAFVWVADMDVDCDGLDYKCKGNDDGQNETNFGALAAYEVPFIVIPDDFYQYYESVLPGNNVAAVICNGKMFYGIFGDTNGADPNVIGEASWLMARTCFPDDDLNGGNGHVPVDVTYIIFTGDDAVLPSSAVGNNYITNFTKLRSMGDSLVNALVSQLGISGATTTTTATTLKTTTTSKASTTTTTTSNASTTATTSKTSTTSKTTTSTATKTTSIFVPTSTADCDWEGHCAGDACNTNDDCDDPWSCYNGYCNYDPTEVCQWDGHCLEAVCSTSDDCSDPWACISGYCGVDTTETCSWTGHCAGAECIIDDDCSDPYACIYGVCAVDPDA